MKKIFVLVLAVVWGLIGFAPGVYADNMDGDFSIITSYTRLLEWREAGCPSNSGSCMIVVSRDFGWPTEEVVIDFGVSDSEADVMLYNGNKWTIPANVTIKNLSIALAKKATLNIEGKLHNNLYYEEGNPPESLRANTATINLGEKAEVKGCIHLCAESTLHSNGGYAENVIASVHNGTSNANLATISGTLVADKLDHHNNMSTIIASGSVIEIGRINGNGANTVHIENGAKVLYTDKIANMMTNINIKTGGAMTMINQPLTTEQSFSIEEGGVFHAYQGINQRSQLSNAKITGAGTIHLYGNATFRYDGADYWENPNVKNPGTIPMLDATIVIKRLDCDHADGKAYRFFSFIPSGETEPTQHVQMCSSCYIRVKGTEAPHTYTLEGAYPTFSRYRCVCGRSYEIARTTGTCGENLSFALESGVLQFDGVGSITEFVPTNGIWADKAEAVQKVVLGSGITTVEENVFSACGNLAKVKYDGTYDDWKTLTIKEGNDALKYAEVTFDDGSVLMPAVGKYRDKADLIFQEDPATGQFQISLLPREQIPEDEVKAFQVIVASFDADGFLSDADLAAPTLTDDGAQWTGSISESTSKLLVWDEHCAPLTR